MKDKENTEEQLIKEIKLLEKRIKELDDSESLCKQAEGALRESEERYRSLAMNIPDVIWTTDRRGHAAFISPNVKTVYGHTPEEFYEGGDRLWFGRIHPDDIDKVKQAYRALFEKRSRFDIEYRIKRKDGKWIWLHNRSTTIYKKDGVLFADGIFSDITKRKQAEEELRKAHDELEKQVERRTADIAKDKEELAIQAWGLEKANEGLRVLYKERMDLLEKFKRLSMTDTHTELYNYRYLMERLASELKRAQRYSLTLSVVMLDVDFFKSINDVYGHLYGDRILQELARFLKNYARSNDVVIRYGGEEFTIVLPDTDNDGAVIFGKRLLGVLNKHVFDPEGKKVRLKISMGISSYPEDGVDVDAIINSADTALINAKETGGNRLCICEDIKIKIDDIISRYTKKTVDGLRKKLSRMGTRANQALIETIYALAKTIEAKDCYTGEHAAGMIAMVREIAKRLNLSGKEIENLEHAAVLHDLGKIGIPDDILLKKGELTVQEYRIIKRHPQIGAEIVRAVHFLEGLVPIILHHHEKFDGSGYPGRLKRRDIPIGARIIALADAYQALISDRPYRKAYGKKEALGFIEQGSGTQFDPEIVNIFLKMIKRQK